ncbi:MULTISPECIES: cell division protein ZapD [Providencia]|uniref:Cell division protein ZapD n=1 Tax=Providencia rettgeri TaxID=587 RepID=A0A3R8VYT5_PRORE|nr:MULTISPECIES: cell division protein ZapD [Providencia]ELR5073101.1 cell division protein ZapD [Providencia stuartii]ELR5071812.1 cell division protein ZapD [Providencia rettgeri]ELR5218198.1 cell division protein ZapD [Providencia rettgeri]ELR5221834.1 cell division protein ZapD [Providencia rettgeri]MBV2190094.1 cell division protein ZapD [Providencia rettgeri]
MGELIATNFITYEYPMNEKIRSWLRLETLLSQIYELSNITSYSTGIAFFRSVSELIEILDRGEVRSELMKELEKQRSQLASWAEAPNADNQLISTLLEQLSETTSKLISAPRFGHHLRTDKIISMVRQRLSIPGGCCSFDLPTLQLWLNIPQIERNKSINGWLQSLDPLKNALNTVLTLIRQSGNFEIKESYNGFYQDNVEGKELLRIKLSIEYLIYPQISGHKTRFALRFLHIDSENGILPDVINFELSCC